MISYKKVVNIKTQLPNQPSRNIFRNSWNTNDTPFYNWNGDKGTEKIFKL